MEFESIDLSYFMGNEKPRQSKVSIRSSPRIVLKKPQDAISMKLPKYLTTKPEDNYINLQNGI
ncbi:MAG: hypothetical protein AABW47_01255 [Nanoarchaeota archaeon]